jgi:GNAT superfamily N-acetyltransferase
VDGRSFVLSITAKGAETYEGLHRRTIAQVEGLIGGLSTEQRQRLTGALDEVQGLLGAPPPDKAYILRPHGIGDLGWVMERHGVVYNREYGWDHRFEALVGRILADFVDNYDPAKARSWIAERRGERVGCVFLEPGEGDGAKLRLLLVEPPARGLGLGRRLVDECVSFAREAGYSEITLWTQSILTAARAIYAAVGFELVDSWPNRDFGGYGLTSEKWRLRL